jgi:hypothetical protein
MKILFALFISLLTLQPASVEARLPPIFDGRVPVRSEFKIGGKTTDAYNFATPTQNIDATATVDPGELVSVKAGAITNVPQYLVGVTYRWQVYTNGKLHKNIQVMPDGTGIFFGSGIKPGKKFNVILSASYLYIVTDAKDNTKVLSVGQRANLLSAEITVTGTPEPGPGPNPNPNPNPTPDIPAGKYGLAKIVYDLSTANVTTDRAKGAQALAKSFRGISSAVSAGTIKTVSDLLRQTKQANTAALSDAHITNTAQWDQFFARLQPVIYDMYNSNRLPNYVEFGVAWNEIAVGLEAVR